MGGHLLSNKVLKDGGLAGALAADHGDLRQVDGHVHAQLGEGILHPIDDRDERLHPLVARRHVEVAGGDDDAGEGGGGEGAALP